MVIADDDGDAEELVDQLHDEDPADKSQSKKKTRKRRRTRSGTDAVPSIPLPEQPPHTLTIPSEAKRNMAGKSYIEIEGDTVVYAVPGSVPSVSDYVPCYNCC